ncbi:MAG TPA: MBL fold metallo-hydrolase [Bacilli bacterium]|nr:MBL fold metallo-hydrolase [Bacilli bacterium]HPS18811.1 MBL fold metallo-hydrolase [Bacilli bacterium]
MLTIEYLGHSCFKIASSDVSFVIDPYQLGSVPGLIFPKQVYANKVFCSHEHHDHNARDNINLIPSNFKISVKEYLLPHDHENGRKRGMVFGRIFEIDQFSLAHLGDVGDISQLDLFDPFKAVDILFVPINGLYTISAKEAKKLADYLKPRLVIPMHYHIDNPPSGYPDDGEIAQFKNFFPQHCEVNSSGVVLKPNLFSYQALIFNKK